MRLVDYDGEALAGERADLLGDDRELLERGDDDPLAGLQRLAELLRGFVDVLDHAERLFELADRALKLAVEHPPVGDDDNRVEDRAIPARRAAWTVAPVEGEKAGLRALEPRRDVHQLRINFRRLPPRCRAHRHGPDIKRAAHYPRPQPSDTAAPPSTTLRRGYCSLAHTQ